MVQDGGLPGWGLGLGLQKQMQMPGSGRMQSTPGQGRHDSSHPGSCGLQHPGHLHSGWGCGSSGTRRPRSSFPSCITSVGGQRALVSHALLQTDLQRANPPSTSSSCAVSTPSSGLSLVIVFGAHLSRWVRRWPTAPLAGQSEAQGPPSHAPGEICATAQCPTPGPASARLQSPALLHHIARQNCDLSRGFTRDMENEIWK